MLTLTTLTKYTKTINKRAILLLTTLTKHLALIENLFRYTILI